MNEGYPQVLADHSRLLVKAFNASTIRRTVAGVNLVVHLGDVGKGRVVMEGAKPVSLRPKWYTVAQVAKLLGYGESKVRMLIIAGDLRSLKDGRVTTHLAGVGGRVRRDAGGAGGADLVVA